MRVAPGLISALRNKSTRLALIQQIRHYRGEHMGNWISARKRCGGPRSAVPGMGNPNTKHSTKTLMFSILQVALLFDKARTGLKSVEDSPKVTEPDERNRAWAGAVPKSLSLSCFCDGSWCGHERGWAPVGALKSVAPQSRFQKGRPWE